MNKIYPVHTLLSKEPKTLCQRLDEEVFQYPFFNEGVLSAKGYSKEKYGLESVRIKNPKEELELKGLIFNVSHCGSTLLCRMLNQIQKVKVVSEPEAINGLLLSKSLFSISEEKIKKQLKEIIKLYQQKTDSKEYLVIKLTSWNVYFIDLFLQLFPETKWLFLDRETASLINSLSQAEGGFLDWWKISTDELRKKFYVSGKEITNKTEYLNELIYGHRMFANQRKSKKSLFLKYPEFIEQHSEILKHLGIIPTDQEINLLRETIQYESKSMVRIKI